ncbi:MAG: extracellular solute-binding protein [Hyphomicrobiales bacterium]
MKTLTKALLAGAGLLALAGTAHADGELNIYNWGNYTSPDVVKKFEEKYNVKVNVTDYDSNDTALAKVRAGGHGFDMVVPSGNYMPIFISEGLLLETRPDQMENFKNVDPMWVHVPYDDGRHYSVPWQWGTVGVSVNTKAYKGDINTWGIVFNTPDELKGKVNVVPEMNDVIDAAIKYNGGTHCSMDKEVLKKARDTLVAAKPNWVAMEYSTIEKMTKGDYLATSDWNGSAMRQRLQNPDIKYGYPKEGFTTWMDNLSVLKDAKNVENAKLFQNFVMDPENAAGLSAFARYANGIAGSAQFMPADMKDAPELNIPKEMEGHYEFATACPPEAVEIYTKIWTELMK